MRVGIIGGGRAAWSFSTLFRSCGWTIEGIALRGGSQSILPGLLRVARMTFEQLARNCDLLFLAVPDQALAAVAQSVGASGADLMTFHASGCVSSAVLSSRRRFSLHPLRALPEVGVNDELRDTLFVFEGSAECEGVGRQLAAAANGSFARIDVEAKGAYHAAAVFASNYVATLCSVAEELFGLAGVGAEHRAAIAELARSAVANWSDQSGDRRFTGPIVRNDAACIENHLDALSNDELKSDLYRRLGLALVEELSHDRQREEIKALLRRVAGRSLP